MLESEDTIKYVRDFAIRAHGEQRYGTQPYVAHLDAVAFVLRQYGYSDPLHLKSAYLHDVVEDAQQEAGYPSWEQRIEQVFGEAAHWVVRFCTTETGQNRKEKQAKNNAKYADWVQVYKTHIQGQTALNAKTPQERLQQKKSYDLLVQWFPVAVRVKLADRLANLRVCSKDNAGLFAMYHREAAAFRDALFVAGICDRMWTEFDDFMANPQEGVRKEHRTPVLQAAKATVAEQVASQHTQPVAAPTGMPLPQANRKHTDADVGVAPPTLPAVMEAAAEMHHDWKRKQVALGARKPGDPLGNALASQTPWSEGAFGCALPPTTTLGQVHEYLNKNCKEGVSCPACNRFVKQYRRKLNGKMVGWLIWLWKAWSKESKWYEAKDAPPQFWLNREHARLLHWGLIEQAPNTDPTKRVSGLYRPTALCYQFVHGLIEIPEAVILQRNKIVNFSEKKIKVQAALGKHFSYVELMYEKEEKEN